MEDDPPIVSARFLKNLSESRMVADGPEGQPERVSALARELARSSEVPRRKDG